MSVLQLRQPPARRCCDRKGNLQPDPKKFPHGIKAVADCVHAKGLKIGIYEDGGVLTCAKQPGSLGHERADANLFASWGIDYLKYDNCFAGNGCAQVTCAANKKVPAQTRYKAMRDALAATRRPIVFSICSWGQDQVWTWGKDYGNLWRTTDDIKPNWPRMLATYQANIKLAAYAGPGQWNEVAAPALPAMPKRRPQLASARAGDVARSRCSLLRSWSSPEAGCRWSG